ncbi:spore germination protein [Effusibacillus dendaii]|uniref:Spore germination protein n=1 Tax=Effusibacillus dendaii TaxID=2743772 RepID=A0A7I8DHK2_9BACL|nr:spore germination protein [Effusibacillus dendaii]BCJ87301.1 spore germination protein [Effusibacillus dendaii]
MGNVKKFLNHLLRSDRKKSANAELPSKNPQTQTLLSRKLNENLQLIQDIYSDCSDVIFHDFLIGDQTKAVLIYIDGLTNVEELDRNVLAPLQQDFALEHTLPNIRKKIAVSSIKHVKTVADVIEEISGGNPVLLMEREKQGLSVGLSKWEKRTIEEPTAESVLRGPREGFIESLRTNTALLRRKVRSPNLKIKSMNIGTYSGTTIAIAYIEGIAAPALVEEMKSRLQRIEIDGILESVYIEELIEDNPLSPFPQLLSTERPDVASAYLLEGHVVVLVDGTPSVLIAPVTIFSLLQSPEDYYERYVVGTAIRWLRYLFYAISLLGPSFYVAIITYHQEMIPANLLLTMAKSREQVPFPALVEALLMESMFEALREAGARLPRQIGTAVSIVGALVIGQAAIAAGIVSAPMVVVVAITGIASFMAPRFTVGIAVRLLRFPMMFLAGFLGLLGVFLGGIVILNHLLTLRSFGVPYMSPLAPMKGRDLKDVLWRAPRWMLNTRPHLTGEWNPYRQAPRQQPSPAKGDEEG